MAARHIAHYMLLKRLGEGGMGAVFLAEDTRSGQRVALKLLSPQLAGGADFLLRFKREADAAKKLTHENIAAALDAGEAGGFHYYAMEFCDGEALDQRLLRVGKLSVDEALDITSQIARGLAFAHSNGIVHRDIKPANLFIAASGTVKILDLGLSKNILDPATLATASGIAVGTPHYMSPEQAEGKRDLDGRTDIYLLGMTLFCMLTGRPPFLGSPSHILAQHVSERLPDPRTFAPEIPPGVVQLIEKMTAKNRAHRQRDCAALIADLEAVRAGAPLPSALSADESNDFPPAENAVQQALSSQRRRTTWVACAGAAVLLALGAIVAVPRLTGRGNSGAVAPAPEVPRVTPADAIAPDVATQNLPKTLDLDLGDGVKLELGLAAPGQFRMGNDAGNAPEAELPIHEVRFKQPFYIGKYPVTVGQFMQFTQSSRYRTEAEIAGRGMVMDEETREMCFKDGANWRKPGFPQSADQPVVLVSWNDARAFAKWLRIKSRQNVRLPSEAEWEFVARSARGIAGSIFQWCEDTYDAAYYSESKSEPPINDSYGLLAAVRGGSQAGRQNSPQPAARHQHLKATGDASIGFRLVVDIYPAWAPSEGAPALSARPISPPPDWSNTEALPSAAALPLKDGVLLELVLVKAGEFEMGAEKPAHVRVAQPFFIGKFPITNKQFRCFVDETGYCTLAELRREGWALNNNEFELTRNARWTYSGSDDNPVTQISWHDAREFCKWASARSGKIVRLPREAEWEYAARGRQSLKYPWGNNWDGTRANHADLDLKKTGRCPHRFNFSAESDGYAYTSPVGRLPNASWCGAFDMAGNVEQWCENEFDQNALNRVLRGGSWMDSNERTCQAFERRPYPADAASCANGFRVAVEIGKSLSPDPQKRTPEK